MFIFLLQFICPVYVVLIIAFVNAVCAEIQMAAYQFLISQSTSSLCLLALRNISLDISTINFSISARVFYFISSFTDHLTGSSRFNIELNLFIFSITVNSMEIKSFKNSLTFYHLSQSTFLLLW